MGSLEAVSTVYHQAPKAGLNIRPEWFDGTRYGCWCLKLLCEQNSSTSYTNLEKARMLSITDVIKTGDNRNRKQPKKTSYSHLSRKLRESA